jgi:hypothetical protein
VIEMAPSPEDAQTVSLAGVLDDVEYYCEQRSEK